MWSIIGVKKVKSRVLGYLMLSEGKIVDVPTRVAIEMYNEGLLNNVKLINRTLRATYISNKLLPVYDNSIRCSSNTIVVIKQLIPEVGNFGYMVLLPNGAIKCFSEKQIVNDLVKEHGVFILNGAIVGDKLNGGFYKEIERGTVGFPRRVEIQTITSIEDVCGYTPKSTDVSNRDINTVIVSGKICTNMSSDNTDTNDNVDDSVSSDDINIDITVVDQSITSDDRSSSIRLNEDGVDSEASTDTVYYRLKSDNNFYKSLPCLNYFPSTSELSDLTYFTVVDYPSVVFEVFDKDHVDNKKLDKVMFIVHIVFNNETPDSLVINIPFSSNEIVFGESFVYTDYSVSTISIKACYILNSALSNIKLAPNSNINIYGEENLYIEDFAFYRSHMNRVTLTVGSNIHLGDSAFKESTVTCILCKTQSNGTLSFGKEVFSNCIRLRKVIWNGVVKRFTSMLFYNCVSLRFLFDYSNCFVHRTSFKYNDTDTSNINPDDIGVFREQCERIQHSRIFEIVK